MKLPGSEIFEGGFLYNRKKSTSFAKHQLLRISFLQLAKEHNFERIEEILFVAEPVDLAAWLSYSPPPPPYTSKAMTISQHRRDEGRRSPLHIIVEYDPPITLVRTLSWVLGEVLKSNTGGCIPEAMTDEYGRTPLHIAAANGCNASVIKQLIKAESGTILPLVTRDHMGRLPLHWACVNPTGRLNNKVMPSLLTAKCGSRSKSFDNMTNVIEILITAYPHAVYVCDDTGMTPLTLAFENKADYCIVQMLAQEGHIHKESRDPFATTRFSHSHDTSRASDLSGFIGFPMEIVVEQQDDDTSIGSGGISTYRHPKLAHGRNSSPRATMSKQFAHGRNFSPQATTSKHFCHERVKL